MINRINLIKNDDHIESEVIRKIEIKVVISYGIVKVAFMLCFLPLFIGTLYQEIVAEECNDRAMISQILSTVASVSACVNSGVILGGVKNKTKKKKKRTNRQSLQTLTVSYSIAIGSCFGTISLLFFFFLVKTNPDMKPGHTLGFS